MDRGVSIHPSSRPSWPAPVISPQGRLRVGPLRSVDRSSPVKSSSPPEGTSQWLGGFDEASARLSPSLQLSSERSEDGFERGDERLDLGPPPDRISRLDSLSQESGWHGSRSGQGENVVAWAGGRRGERGAPSSRRTPEPRAEVVDPEGGTSNLKASSSASRSLASRVRQGVQWKIVSQGTSLILQLATTVVLARLLSPEEFGLAAMVLVFRRLLFLFSDFAFTPALVQRRHLTDKDRSTAFYPV